MMLRVVTFNAGLLSELGGALEPAPHVEQRAAQLAGALLEVDADVIALQEIYAARHKDELARKLAHRYPYAAMVPPARTRLGSGLLTLSRHPLAGERHVRFADGPLEERWLSVRGVLVTAIELGPRRVVVANTHLTAGGLFRHPEAPASDQRRAGQIAQLIAAVAGTTDVAIIAGDMNTGPTVSEDNYHAFERGGFVDAYLAGGGAPRPTWDPANPLNTGGPHRSSPPQRIDHVFVRAADLDGDRVRIASAGVILDAAPVALADGRSVSVSDHYGVRIDLALPGSG